MTEIPAGPPADDKDWTWVLHEPCPDCGYDASTVTVAGLPGLVRSSAGAFGAALARPGAADRPAAAVWSVLEYACHVRDVCRIFRVRADLMLAQDDPQFENWDQDETALAERYWEQAPAVVADELEIAAEAVARTFADVPPGQWQKTGRRSNGSVFTVESLGRYFVHDLVHHVHDIS